MLKNYFLLFSRIFSYELTKGPVSSKQLYEFFFQIKKIQIILIADLLKRRMSHTSTAVESTHAKTSTWFYFAIYLFLAQHLGWRLCLVPLIEHSTGAGYIHCIPQLGRIGLLMQRDYYQWLDQWLWYLDDDDIINIPSAGPYAVAPFYFRFFIFILAIKKMHITQFTKYRIE